MAMLSAIDVGRFTAGFLEDGPLRPPNRKWLDGSSQLRGTIVTERAIRVKEIPTGSGPRDER
jgi:hypothetical protein